MKVLMVFADGFEDVEAIATRDVLIRGGVEVVNARIESTSHLVHSSHGLDLASFLEIRETTSKDYQAIILPGGSRGVNNLLQSKEVERLLKEFKEENKLICAICAAPMVLGKYGYLVNKPFTCYPGCEKEIDGLYTGGEVVVLDKLITARSMLFSIPFGLAILEKLQGKEIRDKIYNQIAGLK